MVAIFEPIFEPLKKRNSNGFKFFRLLKIYIYTYIERERERERERAQTVPNCAQLCQIVYMAHQTLAAVFIWPASCALLALRPS